MSIDKLMEWGALAKSRQPKYEPAYYDYQLYEGTTWKEPISFFNNTATPPTPINITGHTFTLTVKVNTRNKKIIKQLVIGNGMYVTGNDHNILNIDTLVDFIGGTYVYDLIGTAPDGKITPYLKGKLKVEERV